MEKHPFFMKRAPEPGEELHPMLEGLQQLKFDPDDNSPDELAEKYKEDGTYWLKHKKYRIAVMNYTEGIHTKCPNEELMANLYNNRSAAHFFLQNYRSSISDARLALKHKADYTKAKIRILKCLMELKKYDEACKDVQEFLTCDPTNKDFIDLQKQAITKKTEKQRDERKTQMLEKKKRQEFQTLVHALMQRKVKFEEVRNGDLGSKLTPEFLRPKVDPLEYHPVSLDNQGNVYWPVIFCYPEYQLTDLQQQLIETITVQQCLEDMFSPENDDGQPQKYSSADDLNVYYENRLKGKIYLVDQHKPLKEIVSEKEFWIHSGYLTFFVIPKGSDAEKEFVKQIRKPIL